MRIALAQLNAVVGDLDGNVERVTAAVSEAQRAAADIVVLPELAVTGYPPEDLLLRPGFVRAAREAVDEVARACTETVALVGAPAFDRDLANAAFVCAEGTVKGVYRKHFLPNYGVFDEHRYFAAGRELLLLELGDVLVGPTICEDVWQPGPPATDLALAGATLLVNLSASPFHVGKAEDREEMLVTRARDNAAYVAFCNLVGGQDELVFDGHSVVVSADGRTLARAAQFEEELLVCDVPVPPSTGVEPESVGALMLARLDAPRSARPVETRLAESTDPDAEVYAALVLGLRDYVRKNRFQRVLIAVSGGIDSALVLLIAADAVGAENVTGVVMPSPHSSEETQADARAIVGNVGAELVEIPIRPAMHAYDELLAAGAASQDGGGEAHPGAESARELETGGPGAELAAENIQARIRGNLMMALSNQSGWLVLTTGNKSELSVGYATLYGDMAGGFAVIKDVLKTLVYRLVRHRNAVAGRELVPESVLERAPSAELRPDQRDEDSLPPYEVLDRILIAYVEEDRGRDEIVVEGLDPGIVDDVIGMVDRSEYKRRQAAPGIRITEKAFGRDRRLPITNRFRG